MQTNRWNTRLWRGQEIDVADARSSRRRYDCNNEAPFRSHSSWLVYRYVFGPICKSSNQIKISTSVWIAGRSAEMMPWLSAAMWISHYTLMYDARSRVHDYDLSKACMLWTLWDPCKIVVGSIILDCGHIFANLRWYGATICDKADV